MYCSKVSKVWKYFDEQLPKKDSVKCKLCGKILAYNGSSTRSMIRQ